MITTCWYCVHAWREDKSNVVCHLECCYKARTHSVCDKFIRDPKKERAGEEEIHI